MRGAFVLHSCKYLILSILQNLHRSIRYAVESYSGFNLHSYSDSWCWPLVCVFFGHLYLFFCEVCSSLLSSFYNNSYYWIVIDSYLFWLAIYCEICVWQLFFLSLWLLIFLPITFKKYEFFVIITYFIMTSPFFLLWLMLFLSHLEIFCLIRFLLRVL